MYKSPSADIFTKPSIYMEIKGLTNHSESLPVIYQQICIKLL